MSVFLTEYIGWLRELVVGRMLNDWINHKMELNGLFILSKEEKIPWLSRGKALGNQ